MQTAQSQQTLCSTICLAQTLRLPAS